MSGAGNLFFVIDNREYKLSQEEHSVFIKKIYDKSGFKAEGIMFLDNSQEYDFSVSFYNPDGTSGMMCGNGGRCAIEFALQKEFFSPKKNIVFNMAGVEYYGKIEDGIVSIIFPPIKSYKSNIKIEVNSDLNMVGDFIDNGTQHYCVNIDTIEKYKGSNIYDFPLQKIGSKVRWHNEFAPQGANFNIYYIAKNEILLRTYERGVEAETGACGTGAIATAYHSKKYGTKFPIKIIPPSKIPLFVDENSNGDIILKGHSEILDSFFI